MRVCIALPTYRRPAELARALQSLGRLEDAPGMKECVVAIFDNDAGQSARETVARECAALRFPCSYQSVPAKGLSHVRNAVLDFAFSGQFDYLAMLDDDEEAGATWLVELFNVLHDTRADAVFGRVDTHFADPPSSWIRTFRENEYPRLRNLVALTDGWTSNCLLSLRGAAVRDVRFDLTLNFAGGEDQLYFRTLLARGAVLYYAEFAVVTETLPIDRTEPVSVLKRSFRRGNSLAMCDRKLHGSAKRIMLRAFKGVAVCGSSLVRGIVQCIGLRWNGAMTSAIEAARGAGMIAGCLGLKYEAYKQ